MRKVSVMYEELGMLQTREETVGPKSEPMPDKEEILANISQRSFFRGKKILDVYPL